MTILPTELQELADLAVVAAERAGEMIAASTPGDVEHKTGADSLASQVVTAVDRESERMILDALTPTLDRFALGLLTEERDDDGGRHRAEQFWCIDPLDGTLPFIEGAPGYAVSIALVGRDGTPLIGVVHDPVTGTTIHAVAGAGASRNGDPWRPLASESGVVLDVFADRSLQKREGHEALLADLDRIGRDLGMDGAQVHIGSGAVMNACGVLANAPACYFKLPAPSGGGSLWDFAAMACVFREAGAIVSDIHGDPLDLNRADSTFMNHRGVLFATDPELARRIRAIAPNQP